MCVVSNFVDYHQNQWGTPWVDPKQFEESKIIVDWKSYQELRKKAEEYDKLTGQPNCVKPALTDWEEKFEQFLKQKGLL